MIEVRGVLMSVNQDSGRKWIQASVVLFGALMAYVSLAFIEQINGLWDLEAKVSNFSIMSNVIAFAVGLLTFVIIMKNEKASTFLDEVYVEFRKVVFPETDSTWRQTFGIMVGLSIVGFILWLVDIGSGWTLSQLY